MLTSVERNAVQAFSKGNNFLPHCVALCWRFSLDNVHTSDVKFYVLNGKLLRTIHYYTLFTAIYEYMKSYEESTLFNFTVQGRMLL
jgi:hypothetical protein